MAEINPKAYPLADAQLTITILDIVQQAAVRPHPSQSNPYPSTITRYQQLYCMGPGQKHDASLSCSLESDCLSH
jgi:hypothetical protein